MGHSSVRLKVRRRKVAHLRAYSKQFSVHNNCVPKKVGEVKFSWDIPEEGYPQPEHLHHVHKGQKWYRYKDGSCELVRWHHKSQHKDDSIYQKMLWKNLGVAAKMEAYTQDKIKKWERKHPKPCKTDDLFKEEFIPAWEKEREEAVMRIRDFVVSMFDKLPLVGRFKIDESTSKYKEKQIAELKDKDSEGHKVNELKNDSKLLKKAQKVTNAVHARDKKLVCANLGDHKRKHGRIILPKAA